MIVCDKDKWNVVNQMTIIGMLEMNYMINGLILLQMCFKKRKCCAICGIIRLNHKGEHFFN